MIPDDTEFELARLGDRIVANIVDLMVLLFFMVLPAGIAAYLMINYGILSSYHIELLSYPFMLISPVLYFTLFEFKHGQTIGKKYSGIFVVNDQMSRIAVQEALFRNLTRLFFWSWVVKAVPVLLIISSPNARRLGDRFAGTLVVQE